MGYNKQLAFEQGKQFLAAGYHLFSDEMLKRDDVPKNLDFKFSRNCFDCAALLMTVTEAAVSTNNDEFINIASYCDFKDYMWSKVAMNYVTSVYNIVGGTSVYPEGDIFLGNIIVFVAAFSEVFDNDKGAALIKLMAAGANQPPEFIEFARIASKYAEELKRMYFINGYEEEIVPLPDRTVEVTRTMLRNALTKKLKQAAKESNLDTALATTEEEQLEILGQFINLFPRLTLEAQLQAEKLDEEENT